ncbi:hypothetical protein [Asanoa siamensis]|uniref:Exo-alpha-sialidase n=1 Tax=Asanoa siamensis TaxID=926357 RepID=A0ABQ4CVQ5_9ACTN|nr:hypothetical protein [Asanoa siamensis]GIF75369.1 hypothetical protein Asi02nite_48870 [Asanoa siamensis]
MVRTEDGGQSWHQALHPQPEGKSHQLYAGDDRLVLHVEPDGYYVSYDQGRTYTHEPGAADPARPLAGDYQVCCDGDTKQKVVFFGLKDRPIATPAQPDVPNLRVVGSALHWLYAIGVDSGGRPVGSVSNDLGSTWRQVPIAGESGDIAAAQIVVDHDRTYAWLIGQPDPIGWPAIWFFDGQGWRSMGATGHPDNFLSAVALPDATLAVTTRDRPGLVSGGAFQWVDWPIGGRCGLRLLADGTLFCGDGQVNWLGVGGPGRWKWIRVLVGGAG